MDKDKERVAIDCQAEFEIVKPGMRVLIFIFSIIILLNSCGISKHLVYIDDWEGNYTLRKNDNCCDTATQVKIKLMKRSPNEYDWKLFFTRADTDTIFGKAVYRQNKLNFYVVNADVADRFFENAVSTTIPVFRLEYDNYHKDKDFLYIGHYTRWYNELKNYKHEKGLFAGGSYHFKKDGTKESRKLPRA